MYQMMQLSITPAVKITNPFRYAVEYLMTQSHDRYLLCSCLRSVSGKMQLLEKPTVPELQKFPAFMEHLFTIPTSFLASEHF
jgi:hypothetical protein